MIITPTDNSLAVVHELGERPWIGLQLSNGEGVGEVIRLSDPQGLVDTLQGAMEEILAETLRRSGDAQTQRKG